MSQLDSTVHYSSKSEGLSLQEGVQEEEEVVTAVSFDLTVVGG